MLKRFRQFVFISLLSFGQLTWAVDPIYATFFSNIALNGYDVVSYYTKGAAYKGSTDFEYEWKGATWRFSSEGNMNLFKQHPERYEPQYGGYCAYAVANGQTASSDPHQFTIIEGKLFMNYNNKTKILWTADREEFIAQANENWPNLVDDD